MLALRSHAARDLLRCASSKQPSPAVSEAAPSQPSKEQGPKKLVEAKAKPAKAAKPTMAMEAPAGEVSGTESWKRIESWSRIDEKTQDKDGNLVSEKAPSVEQKFTHTPIPRLPRDQSDVTPIKFFDWKTIPSYKYEITYLGKQNMDYYPYNWNYSYAQAELDKRNVELQIRQAVTLSRWRRLGQVPYEVTKGSNRLPDRYIPANTDYPGLPKVRAWDTHVEPNREDPPWARAGQADDSSSDEDDSSSDEEEDIQAVAKKPKGFYDCEEDVLKWMSLSEDEQYGIVAEQRNLLLAALKSGDQTAEKAAMHMLVPWALQRISRLPERALQHLLNHLCRIQGIKPLETVWSFKAWKQQILKKPEGRAAFKMYVRMRETRWIQEEYKNQDYSSRWLKVLDLSQDSFYRSHPEFQSVAYPVAHAKKYLRGGEEAPEFDQSEQEVEEPHVTGVAPPRDPFVPFPRWNEAESATQQLYRNWGGAQYFVPDPKLAYLDPHYLVARGEKPLVPKPRPNEPTKWKEDSDVFRHR